MKKALLIHSDRVPLPHYRMHIYRYLHNYLKMHGYFLEVVSDRIQEDYEGPIGFPLHIKKTGLISLIRTTLAKRPHASILAINHSKLFFFPFMIFLKAGKFKPITWTHGVNLQRKHSKLSRLIHDIEHALCDGIVLYAESQKEFISKRDLNKVFIANNTLNLTEYENHRPIKIEILEKYGIHTRKNVICVGRIQGRKRIQDLIMAFKIIKNKDYGLIVVGHDEEGLIEKLRNCDNRIVHLGPLYGIDVIDLLCSCEVFCIPGAIGLSIVDAMFCGLPVVTERVDHGPEIMYLRDGENGYMVQKGDYKALAERICLLLENDNLRLRFSSKAREEIVTNGHIDNLCKGILQCLQKMTTEMNS